MTEKERLKIAGHRVREAETRGEESPNFCLQKKPKNPYLFLSLGCRTRNGLKS